MKLVTTLLTLAFALNASQALAKGRTESISSLAAKLGKVLGDSLVETNLKKGRTARALIEQKYLADNGLKELDEEFTFEEMVNEIQESDGSGRGTATLDAAQSFVISTIEQQLNTDKDGVELSSKQLNTLEEKATDLLQRLSDAGAEFGYDANGSGVCGMNFTTLYVIDVPQKTIHEYVVIHGPC